MDEYLSRLRTVLGLAESNILSDRRKFLQELDNAYTDDQCIKAINAQTTKDFHSLVSWNQIVLAIHRIALSEAEKAVGKASTSNITKTTQNSCSYLVVKTVQFATNSGCISLSCEDLLNISFQVWENKIYQAHQEACVNILLYYILPNDIYRLQITAKQWQEILRLTTKMYLESPTALQSVLLNIMTLVVQYGCLESHLLEDVKKMLPFLEKVFQGIDPGKESMLKQIYKLTYMVCLQTSTESRMALCEFSEKILPSINYLESCPEKYELLLLLIKINHPGGVSCSAEDNVDNRDWSCWRDLIRVIYHNIIKETKVEKLDAIFLQLCCEVYKQILDDPTYFAEGPSQRMPTLVVTKDGSSQVTHSNKFRKLTMNFAKPIDILHMNKNLHVSWPFIQILTALLDKYPQSLKASDYLEFLETVMELFKGSLDNEVILGSLCELSIILVMHEKDHYNKQEQIEGVTKCWRSIWEVALRALSTNTNELPCYKLIQVIIRKKNIPNPHSFLLLYIKSVIKWSPMSVKSLQIFFTSGQKPISELPNSGAAETAREESSISLLKWVLDIPASIITADIPLISIGKLVTSLVIKSFWGQECNRPDERNVVTFVNKQQTELFENINSKTFTDMEKCHRTLIFQTNIFDNAVRMIGIGESKVVSPQDIREDIIEKLFDSLSECSEPKSLIGRRELRMCVVKITIVAQVLSNLAESNVAFEGDQISKLHRAFSEAYKNVLSDFMTTNKAKFSDPSENEDSDRELPIEVLQRFFVARYHHKIEEIVVERTSRDFIKYINELTWHGNSQACKLEEMRVKESAGSLQRLRVRNSAEKILAYFCSLRIGGSEKIVALFTTALNSLTELIEACRCKRSECIKRVLKIFAGYCSSNPLAKSDECFEAVVEFVHNLLKVRGQDDRVVICVLEAMPRLMKDVPTSSRSANSILSILVKINKSLVGKNHGPLVHAELIKCLGGVLHLDPQLKWDRSRFALEPISQHLISYIDNASYAVRLEVARALHVLFSSKQLDLRSKHELFDKVVRAVKRSFTVDQLSMDELVTRRVTAMHMLAAVIRDNEWAQLHTRALLAIVELSISRSIKPAIVKRAILLSAPRENDKLAENWPCRLAELNIHKLISYWLESGNSPGGLPWIITDCDSHLDFSRKYIDALTVIKLQRMELEDVQCLCKELDVSFVRVIEDCFPDIMVMLFSMKSGKVQSSTSTSSSIDRQNSISYARALHERLHSNIGEFSGVKKFSILLNEKLPELLVAIFTRLHDPNHLNAMLEISTTLLNIDDPSSFDRGTVEVCLRSLEEDISLERNTLIQHIVTRHPNVLQKTLLTLASKIHEADLLDRHFETFYQYTYFCAIVNQEIAKDFFDHMSLYFVRDVSHSLLGIIKGKPSLSEVACRYFEKFVDGLLPTRADHVKEVLSVIISTLTPIVQNGKVRGAMSLLRYLIVEQSPILAEAIGKLDAFPKTEVFNEIRQIHESLKYGAEGDYSLEREIEHFLNATKEKKLPCRLEGLSHLDKHLSSRKKELSLLYEQLGKSRGCAEDCAKSVLHRLIYKLFRLAVTSETNISLEAAKCLGELGPADLTTVILHPEQECAANERQNHDHPDKLERVEILILNMIKHLSEYLVDHDVELRKASAALLYTVFSTRWASKFADKSYLNITLKHLWAIENSTLYDCIYPFICRDKKISRVSETISIDETNLKILMNRSDHLWIPKDHDVYSKWIIDVTSSILDCFTNPCIKSFKSVCDLSVEFSEMLFPRLLVLLVETRKSLATQVCRCINGFFRHLFESFESKPDDTVVALDTPPEMSRKNSSSNNNCELAVSRSRECVRSMLRVVDFLRTFSIDDDPIRPLELDYLLIANAADYVSAYFTSLLYAELSCQFLLRDSEFSREKLPGNWVSAIDSICKFDNKSGKLLQSIVRKAYLHIGEPDSIYGCGIFNLNDSSFRSQHYTHLKQWDKVVLEQDMDLDSTAVSTSRDMLNALEHSGHRYLLQLVLNSTDQEDNCIDDFMGEAAWRLADWRLLETSSSGTDAIGATSVNPRNFKTTDDYYALHYCALECLRNNNSAGLANAILEARATTIKTLEKTPLECSQMAYPILSQLQMFRELEEFATEMTKTDKLKRLLDKWDQQDVAHTHDFRYIEPILSQRLAMYRMRKSDSDNSATSVVDLSIAHTYLKIARVAQKQGYLAMASRALETLTRQEDLPEAERHETEYNKALLASKEEERNVCHCLMKNLVNKPTLDARLRAKCLRICGNWMAEAQCENPQVIIQQYYEESIRTSSNIHFSPSDDVKILTDAQADLAQFADTRYHEITKFILSEDYNKIIKPSSKNDKNSTGAGSKAEPDDNMEVSDSTVGYLQHATDNVLQMEDISKEKDMYLVLAASNYLMTLKSSHEHDLLVYRLISLWLDNKFHKELNKILEEGLPKIASYKFITLLCQLAPHLSNVENDFTVKIKSLLERCAMEHPHHTLPVVLALKNTYKDEEFKPSESSSRKSSKIRLEPRVIAADALISQLTNSEIRPIIREINLVSHALVMLAYHQVQEKKGGAPHIIPRNQAITRVRNFSHTIVPTITLNISPNGNYDNIVGIREYETKFELPGGANAPKNIVCVGTDGIQRRQLVKGQDDLRQDAVMQQVCSVMNSMLKGSRRTNRRRLQIRTYKIVPLSRRSGILEWCHNTAPISHILTDNGGKPGMHTKYYPKDWSVKEVQKKSYQVKLRTFLEICKNLHPAFHHFFMEMYPSAETWFERRLAYVRSVATTSMVGYILGLGDRHFSNILIDKATAEVIHIDFGIAFAQGKVLPIPETVPFRLTRDMEVAMGICGVEGVMRRSCEETVAVLRDRRKTLITVLQVLLYDPLFSWAITPMKTEDPDNLSSRFTRDLTDYQCDEKKTNEIAEKALLKIDEKLQGSTDGMILSIAGQVERLIQQARDPANLCRLFCGWQPYL